MDAIRADDCVRGNHAAIRKREQDSTGFAIEPDELLVEVDALARI